MGTGGVAIPPSSGANPDQQREALDKLLASGIFDRAPSLGAFLRYICLKHFEGNAEGIKEYNIAVEALGRLPDFDKRRDSIVRVEAHRLRKRLQSYYEEAGAGDPVRIIIPEGSYVPRFIEREPPPPEPPVSSTPPARLSWALFALPLVVAVFALSWVAWTRQGTVQEPAAVPEEATLPAPALPPPGREVRILAGRGQGTYIDRYGQAWEGDRYYQGGTAATTRHQEVQGLDRNYFAGMRVGDFRYDIPLESGIYELHLIFAETEVAGESSEGDHGFAILANGAPLLPGFDVVDDAGGAGIATIKIFKDVSPAPDGKLHLEFRSHTVGKAFVNAIEILPGIRGSMRPVRMVVRKEAYRDVDGNIWLPDRFVRSGIVISRPSVPIAVPQPELYRCERYGNFTYPIPVAMPGRYAVRLYFNEFWFGPSAPGLGGVGSRIFRVFCNHKLLLDNYDLFRDAGGTGHGVVKVFRNLTPNAQGKLVLQFESIVNYALVNAIEVLDEANPSGATKPPRTSAARAANSIGVSSSHIGPTI